MKVRILGRRLHKPSRSPYLELRVRDVCPRGAVEVRPRGAAEIRPRGAVEVRPRGAVESRARGTAGAAEIRPPRTRSREGFGARARVSSRTNEWSRWRASGGGTRETGSHRPSRLRSTVTTSVKVARVALSASLLSPSMSSGSLGGAGRENERSGLVGGSVPETERARRASRRERQERRRLGGGDEEGRRLRRMGCSLHQGAGACAFGTQEERQVAARLEGGGENPCRTPPESRPCRKWRAPRWGRSPPSADDPTHSAPRLQVRAGSAVPRVMSALCLRDDEEQDDECTAVASRAELNAALAAKAKQRPCLIIASGGSTIGKMFRLDQEITVGRSESATVRLDQEGVSRLHAKFVVTPEGGVDLLDLNSRNGTFVNGESVSRIALRDGDKIQIGTATILKFSYQDALDEALQQNLYDSATKDALTNLANKRTFSETILKEFAFAKRQRRPLALISFDLDRFKRINDTYGHSGGETSSSRSSQKSADGRLSGWRISAARVGGGGVRDSAPGCIRSEGNGMRGAHPPHRRGHGVRLRANAYPGHGEYGRRRALARGCRRAADRHRRQATVCGEGGGTESRGRGHGAAARWVVRRAGSGGGWCPFAKSSSQTLNGRARGSSTAI